MMSGKVPNNVPPSAPYSNVSLNSGVNNNRLTSNFDFYKYKKMRLIPNKIRSTNPTSWDHSSSDINKLLGQKYHMVISNPEFATYDSLVGQISYVIGHQIVSSGEGCYLLTGHDSERLFLQIRNKDIYVPSAGQYPPMIDEMIRKNVANKDTAVQILECISRPCEMNDPENLANLGPKIFEGLQDLEDREINPAKKLVAVLICEAIRFKDNGASVRMAIRKVIDLYNSGIPNDDPEPFKKVFINNGKDNGPIAVFALSGGREIMDQQIIGPKSIVKESDRQNFEKHRDAINDAKDNISDDDDNYEEEEAQDNISDDGDPQPQSNSNFNTSNEPSGYVLSAPYATHPMVKKDRVRTGELYKDSSSNNTTPIRTTSDSPPKNVPPLSWDVKAKPRVEDSDQEAENFFPPLTSNSPGGTENDNDNYREEEAQREFDENQTQNNDNEEEPNDSIEPSSTINNGLNKSKKSYRSIYEYPVMSENEMKKMIDDLLKNIDP